MLVPLETIFDIQYPKQLTFNKQKLNDDGINFVSSKSKNGGVVAKVALIPDAEIYAAGAITVPLKGSVLHAHLQLANFYCAHQIAVLSPKAEVNLSIKQRLFYVLCIRRNRFRYSYGRQADRTLPKLLVPSIDQIPAWVNSSYKSGLSRGSVYSKQVAKPDSQHAYIQLNRIFDIKKGQRLTKKMMKKGETPFVASISSNNGVRQKISVKPNHLGNTITINYNSSVGEAFYQPYPFFASDDVNVLYPKFQMNQFHALFLITLIRLEKFRFSYGRKWNLRRMQNSRIRVPITSGGVMDLDFMERYIKSLPFSSNLLKLRQTGVSSQLLELAD